MIYLLITVSSESFGNKDLLIAFLNALFESDGKVIKSVTYINKEMTPLNKEDRTIFYDVLCKVDGQEDIIIEMQHKPQNTFRERSLYYMSRAIDNQAIGKKRWKYKIHPVYGIFITNFHLKEVNLPEEPVSEYVIKNAKTNEVFTNKFRMFFIDLLTFKKNNEDELENDLEKWIYSIKNMGNLNTAPKMASSGVFYRLYTTAEVAALSTRQRNLYERSLKNYRDLLADKETTKERMIQERMEGIAIGEERGIAIGEERERVLQLQKQEQERISNINNMRALGQPDELIAKFLQLPLEYVKQH